MNRQSVIFSGFILITSGAVAIATYRGSTLAALALGVAGLLFHWATSHDASLDEETADASYFFGFVLTLVILAVGLYKLSELSSPNDVASTGFSGNTSGTVTATGTVTANSVASTGFSGNTGLILGFLKDLAAGLTLTFVGLCVRQVRILAGAANRPNETSLIAAQLQLTQNLKGLAKVWAERPEHQVLEQLIQSRTITQDATVALHNDIVAAGKRMLAASAKLEDATNTSTETMTRTASALGETLTQTVQRIETEVSLVLKAIEKQRVLTGGALNEAQLAATRIRDDADKHLQEHLRLWQDTLHQTKSSVAAVRLALEEEYTKGVKAFAESGKAFEALTNQTVGYVEALPNPAERLSALWDGVSQLETNLRGSIERSIKQLGALSVCSKDLATALGQLSGSAGVAATALNSSGEKLASELSRELDQMNRIVEEYLSLLATSTRSLRVR